MSASFVTADGAHDDIDCHPDLAGSSLPPLPAGSSQLDVRIIAAIVPGSNALKATASFAGRVMTTSASPLLHASRIWRAAERALVDSPGIESEMWNQVNSRRLSPLNQAL